MENLEALEVIFDDFACPDIDFTFNTEEISKEAGILATYSIVIGAAIAATSFRLDFGDGEFTTTELSGTHRYAINARIDPIVTVSNSKCQIIQTPINRENPAEPPPNIVEEFEVPIPECSAVPEFNFVPCEVPEPNLRIPPVILPCPPDTIISFTQGDIVVNISSIGVGDLISIINVVGIPSFIDLPPIPPTIIIDPPIPPTIIIVPPPDSEITFNLNAVDLPEINVNWGTPPEMAVQMTMVKPIQNMSMLTIDDLEKNEFGTEFADLFQAQNSIKVQYEPVDLPSEIRLIAPEIPKVEFGEPPQIKVDINELKFPDIKITGPDEPIPVQLNFVGENIPDEIELVYKGEPIKLETTKITIEMEKDIPDRITIDPIKIDASDIPKTITLEGSTIELLVPENIGIPLIFPEKMPEVEMVYKGAPIEVKITMDEIMADADRQNCVMITPCGKP